MKTKVWGALSAIVTICLMMMPLNGRRDIEADILDEVNFLRASPASYASELEEYQRRFIGRIAFGKGDEPDLATYEGVRPVLEAAHELRRVRSKGEIRHSDILARAAADHVRAQEKSGQTGHISNGKRPGDRVKALGGDIYVGEAIVYGVHGNNAVRQMVVDDGVPDRGHRKLLLTANIRYAGVACGAHPKWHNMCVLLLSETRDGSPVIATQN